MTELDKKEIVDAIKAMMDEQYGRFFTEEIKQQGGSKSALKNVRNKWFRLPDSSKSPMFNIFGPVVYWQVWDSLLRLTCLICGCRYARNLDGCAHAEEVAEALCQTIYNLRAQANKKVEEHL